MTNGAGSLADGKAEWTYGLGSGSIGTALTVTDANGKVVFTAPGETTTGTHTFQWDGKDAARNALPPGPYKLTVTAKAADGTAVNASVASKGVVSAIDMSSGSPELVVGSMVVPLSDATLIGAT
jgi:flagellar basal-body rod modification protein FlgD